MHFVEAPVKFTYEFFYFSLWRLSPKMYNLKEQRGIPTSLLVHSTEFAYWTDIIKLPVATHSFNAGCKTTNIDKIRLNIEYFFYC